MGTEFINNAKIKDNKEKMYYLNATDKLGWSRSVLLNQIKAEAYYKGRWLLFDINGSPMRFDIYEKG
ncbi:MAG: hypothetical protein KAG64_00320 [Bacteroidales bacterium]|nr:hypothetical protein [Bacteroidales bacterium]